MSWDETKEWASLLEFETVPVIYDGDFNEERIRKLYSERFGENEMEGYVVRLADAFHYRDFRHFAGKYVREGHNTLGHQRKTIVTPNKLKDST